MRWTLDRGGGGSDSGRGHCLVYLERHFTCTMLFTPIKMGTDKFTAGGNRVIVASRSCPGRSRNTPSRFLLCTPG